MDADRAGQLRTEFYEKHKDAHYLVIDTRTGFPLGAIYYSFDWEYIPEVRKKNLREFFAAVQELEFREGKS